MQNVCVEAHNRSLEDAASAAAETVAMLRQSVCQCLALLGTGQLTEEQKMVRLDFCFKVQGLGAGSYLHAIWHLALWAWIMAPKLMQACEIMASSEQQLQA